MVILGHDTSFAAQEDGLVHVTPWTGSVEDDQLEKSIDFLEGDASRYRARACMGNVWRASSAGVQQRARCAQGDPVL